MSDSASTQAASALKRGLGRWDLTAFGVNIVIGSAVFLTPSLVAAQLGKWAPVAIIVAGLAVLCIALCFAEVGSRFDRTGGPYLYTLAAFGKFWAFEVGWILASLTIIAAATAAQLIAGGAALAAGAVVFGLTPWLGRQLTESAVVSTVTPSTDQASRQEIPRA